MHIWSCAVLIKAHMSLGKLEPPKPGSAGRNYSARDLLHVGAHPFVAAQMAVQFCQARKARRMLLYLLG